MDALMAALVAAALRIRSPEGDEAPVDGAQARY